MICPICNKEVNRPIHISKSKDRAHQDYIESQCVLAESLLLNENMPLVDIQNDKRIIMISTITDYLYKHHKDLLLNIGRDVRNKRISEKMYKDGGLRKRINDELLNAINDGVEGIDYVECRICNLKSKNISQHIIRVHQLSSKEYKNLYSGAELFSLTLRNKYRKNMIENNPNDKPEAIEKMMKTKALTKDERIKKSKADFASGKRKPAMNIGRGIGGFRPDLGHYCRSMWEANIARIFKIKGIQYTFESRVFPFYNQNGELIDSYLADFHLTQSNVIVEVKGQMDEVSQMKIDLMKQHYPDVRFFLLDGEPYERMTKAFKQKLGKRLEYSKRNIETHPHLYER